MASYVLLLVLFILARNARSNTPTAPYVSFLGETLCNHAYVDLNQVGSNEAGVDSIQCHTDLTSCCGPPGANGSASIGGDWFAPAVNALRLPADANASGVYEVHERKRIDLRRGETGEYASGIYRCEIDTQNSTELASGNREILYVGLYTSGGGHYACIYLIR